MLQRLGLLQAGHLWINGKEHGSTVVKWGMYIGIYRVIWGDIGLHYWDYRDYIEDNRKERGNYYSKIGLLLQISLTLSRWIEISCSSTAAASRKHCLLIGQPAGIFLAGGQLKQQQGTTLNSKFWAFREPPKS